jgi:small subunit ribosomal protein S16
MGKREEKRSMSVKIRLKRTGKTHAPSYRVVVADTRSPRDGRIIEQIGWYNPRTEPSTIHIDAEKAQYWMKHGALPTESVASLLRRAGITSQQTPQAAPAAASEPTVPTPAPTSF